MPSVVFRHAPYCRAERVFDASNLSTAIHELKGSSDTGSSLASRPTAGLSEVNPTGFPPVPSELSLEGVVLLGAVDGVDDDAVVLIDAATRSRG